MGVVLAADVLVTEGGRDERGSGRVWSVRGDEDDGM